MSEHLIDLNILQSRKTYGRKKKCRSPSVFSEDGEFPAFVEELYADEISETPTSVTGSSYNKNITQKDVNPKMCLFSDEDSDYYISGSADSPKDHISSPILETSSKISETPTSVTNSSYNKNNTQKDVNPKMCLFSDEDSDYYIFGSADSPKDHISSPILETSSEISETPTSVTNSSYNINNTQKDVNPKMCLFSDEDSDYYTSGSTDSSKDHISSPILETSSSGLNYQGMRKNLTNRLNNEQHNSEKTFKLPSQEENLNSLADTNECKSASNFLNLNQETLSVQQSSPLSKNSQVNHPKIDVISSDDSVNKLPQKSSEISTIQEAKQPEKIYGKLLLFENPLIRQSIFPIIDLVKKFSEKNNQTLAGNKKIRKKCELTPVKKKSVANSAASSKRNSCDKKTLNSIVSVRKSGKNVTCKSDVINTGNLDVKKGGLNTPPKSVRKQNIRSFDKVERSVDTIGSVRNTDTSKKIGTKKPSDAVQKSDIKRSIKILTKYVSKHKLAKNSVKARIKSPPIRTTSNLHSMGNATIEKIPSDCDENPIKKLHFINSNEKL